MKVFDGKNGRVVVEYDSIKQAGLPPATKLERINELSDGYHTYDELYEFRKMYNAVLFNEWALNYYSVLKDYTDVDVKTIYPEIYPEIHPEIQKFLNSIKPKYNVHKSWKHNDGELCFGGGWFIVSAMLPTGLISNHYKAEDWDLFQIPEVEKALYEFDGHTSKEVLERLKSLI